MLRNLPEKRERKRERVRGSRHVCSTHSLSLSFTPSWRDCRSGWNFHFIYFAHLHYVPPHPTGRARQARFVLTNLVSIPLQALPASCATLSIMNANRIHVKMPANASITLAASSAAARRDTRATVAKSRWVPNRMTGGNWPERSSHESLASTWMSHFICIQMDRE